MRIGIDIDGVVVDTIRFCSEEMTKRLGCNITCEDIVYKFPQTGEMKDYWDKYEKILLCSIEPMDGVIQALNILHEQHEVYFVSSRFKRSYDITVEWFKKHNLPYKNIILTDGNSKVDTCTELGLELFVEDSEINAQEIAEIVGIPVILYKTEYNKNFKNDGVIHCENWDEIINKIKETEKK